MQTSLRVAVALVIAREVPYDEGLIAAAGEKHVRTILVSTRVTSANSDLILLKRRS